MMRRIECEIQHLTTHELTRGLPGMVQATRFEQEALYRDDF
jgi:hypothetical protein